MATPINNNLTPGQLPATPPVDGKSTIVAKPPEEPKAPDQDLGMDLQRALDASLAVSDDYPTQANGADALVTEDGQLPASTEGTTTPEADADAATKKAEAQNNPKPIVDLSKQLQEAIVETRTELKDAQADAEKTNNTKKLEEKLVETKTFLTKAEKANTKLESKAQEYKANKQTTLADVTKEQAGKLKEKISTLRKETGHIEETLNRKNAQEKNSQYQKLVGKNKTVKQAAENNASNTVKTSADEDKNLVLKDGVLFEKTTDANGNEKLVPTKKSPEAEKQKALATSQAEALPESDEAGCDELADAEENIEEETVATPSTEELATAQAKVAARVSPELALNRLYEAKNAREEFEKISELIVSPEEGGEGEKAIKEGAYRMAMMGRANNLLKGENNQSLGAVIYFGGGEKLELTNVTTDEAGASNTLATNNANQATFNPDRKMVEKGMNKYKPKAGHFAADNPVFSGSGEGAGYTSVLRFFAGWSNKDDTTTVTAARLQRMGTDILG